MKVAVPRAFRRRKKHPLSWRRRWRVLVLDLLGREEPPERVAAAIALGVGIGFSPFLGLHFVMAIALAVVFRLNKIDAILGQFAGNPWTFPPVYALGYRLGRAILSYDRRTVPRLNWQPILENDSKWILHPVRTLEAVFGHQALLPRALSFVVGTSVIAIAIGLAAYWIARTLLTLYHRRHPRVAVRAARRRDASSRKRRSHNAPRES